MFFFVFSERRCTCVFVLRPLIGISCIAGKHHDGVWNRVIDQGKYGELDNAIAKRVRYEHAEHDSRICE